MPCRRCWALKISHLRDGAQISTAKLGDRFLALVGDRGFIPLDFDTLTSPITSRSAMGGLTIYWDSLGLARACWDSRLVMGRPPASRQVHKTKLQLYNSTAVLEQMKLSRVTLTSLIVGTSTLVKFI